MANSSIYDAFERLWQHSNNKFVDKNNLGSAAYTETTDYDTRGKADAALASAKTYADGKADAALASAKTYADEIKNNLLNGAGAAYDTLKELGELIDENQDTIKTLENIANGKADAVHIHAISEISGLQDVLDNNTTPVKGVDYWTEADQESIVQQVITALGTPVFGRVDADNNIILTGELTDGIYKLWYEDATGKMTEICTYDTSPGYINWIKRSIEIDDTPYNGGQGWKANTRLNSSGLETTSSAEGVEVSGFIPVKLGDIIYFKNIVIKNIGSEDYPYSTQTYLTIYDKDKNMLMSKNLGYLYLGSTNMKGYGLTLDAPKGNIIEMRTSELYNPGYPEVDWRNKDMAFFRISCEEINDDSIITVNQKIEEDEIPDVERPNYDNWIPYSTEVDGVTLYNGGQGWKANTRWSASGGGDIYASGVYTCGYIPVSRGDIIRIKNIRMNRRDYEAGLENACTVPVFTELGTGSAVNATDLTNYWSAVWDGDDLVQFTINNESCKYIRLNTAYIGSDSTLTINKEIPEDDEPTDTNLFVPTTATLNTRMSGTNQQPKAHDGYVMSAMIHLPLELTLGSTYDESTPYIAVPSTMWANSANLLGYRYDGIQNGYMSADGTVGTIVGDWVKVPLYNQWGGTVTITDFVISLYVSASAITESDIQNIKIYFNECPGDDKVDNTNLLLSATDVNGTIYNGTGYKEGIRINSSGQAVEATGCVSTGFIPVKHGDTIKLYNMLYPLSDTPLTGTELSGANYKIALYNSDKTALSSTSIIELGISTGLAYVADENDYAKAITLVGDDSNWWGAVAYFRITATEITSKSVITVHDGSTGLGDIGAFALTWTEGIKIDKNTGTESSDSAYGASQMFDITAGYNYTASQINRYGYSAGGITICYYDANEIYLGYEELWPATPAGPHSELLTPLAGAAKFRLRLYYGETLDAKFYSLTYEKIPEEEPAYTNQIPISTDTDGSIYNKSVTPGYKSGVRLSISSGYTETAVTDKVIYLTGFIPVAVNDVIRFENMTIPKGTDHVSYIYMFDSEKQNGGVRTANDVSTVTGTNTVYDENNNLIQFTAVSGIRNNGFTGGYFRFAASAMDETSIITINEEITESGNETIYTNQIPISTDEDGNILNGVGYVEGYRIDSSGALAEAHSISTTGYIPCKNGDILRGSAGIIGDNTGWTGIVLYDENKTWIASVKQTDLAYSSKWIVNDDSSFYLDTTAAPISEHGDFSYIRFHSQHISDDGMIITVNEDIEGVSGPSSSSYTNLANPADSNWILDKRYNSSYVLTDYTGGVITNYIDVSGVKEYIAIKGINMKEGNGRIYSYPSPSDAPVNFVNTNASSSVTVADYDSSVFIIPAHMFSNSANYLWRFGGQLTDFSENVVITIDEEIR